MPPSPQSTQVPSDNHVDDITGDTAEEHDGSASHTPTKHESLEDNASVNGEDDSYTPERPSYISRNSSMITTPGVLSRSPSWSGSYYQDQDELDAIPPLDRLTLFDFLENLALPQRLEQLQMSLSSRTEKMRRSQQKLRDSSKAAREKVVGEWRKRMPGRGDRESDREHDRDRDRGDGRQIDRYRRRFRDSVDRFGKRWNDAKTVTTREKVSFIAGVLNIYISGFLMAGFPQWFHVWYTLQLAYYYPIRFYTYRKRGYHYFLADLCYFVNFLLLLSIWVFPGSKRLFISTFCLAFGNNAVAIAMWRNSLVFHSVEKVTSLFIHIAPCATIHTIVHLIPASFQESRFPAVFSIRTSLPGTPEHYSLSYMIVWATVPYAVWQLSYHFLITIRRREKIAAGRPTSFTWLRRSFANTWIGKTVLGLPDYLQEPAFMLIQYTYALCTMVPAPLWFWSSWASAAYLSVVFTWSIYNGATYYIDVFGTRFQKELEKLKQDVAKMYLSPEIGAKTPLATPRMNLDGLAPGYGELSLGAAAADYGMDSALPTPAVDAGPGPEGMGGASSGVYGQDDQGLHERRGAGARSGDDDKFMNLDKATADLAAATA